MSLAALPGCFTLSRQSILLKMPNMSINMPAAQPPNQPPKSSAKLPIGVLLSLSTGPFLCLLLGGRAVAIVLRELGQTSEELFRGDRLPILKITVSDAEQSAL